MIDLIRGASRANPDAPAIVSSGGTVSYGQLLAQAEDIARGLHSRGITRAACVVTHPPTLVAVMAAASAVGCETCAYAPLLPDAGIDELAEAFGHTVVLTDRDLQLSGAEAVLIKELPLAGGELASASSQALLVLTTGTTARPKAARHDWARLMAPAQRRATEADQRWLLAFNLNQFAGLQVLLHVLASGATLVVPDSIQPRDALAAMLEHDVTHLSATPTFWRFLVALLDNPEADRPTLRQATLGGEAASAHLLDEVHRLFPDAKVSHIYASTEVGSGVSVTDGLQGLPVSVLERSDESDVQFRIVEGQLEARSQVGMSSYYGVDADGGDDDDGWLPTGDLVEIVDGRICFVGRSTETINVGGVKVHPLSIENVVSAVPGVQLVHAYAKANPVSGQIVSVDVVPMPAVDTDELEDAIRAACEVLAPAAQPRRVRFVEQLDLKENKISRASKKEPTG
ncbi:MAG TPA: class I adenylate-forming enzyme family protein [Acidimicrobiales bacterium]